MIKKRILIIGSNGMLGQRLCEYYLAKTKVELLCASIEENSFMDKINYQQVDLTQKNSVRDIVHNFYPDLIINTVAYTNVDKAETEREIAWSVNVSGVEYLSQSARAIDSHLIHISSDYIFDGKKVPYHEKDVPNPLSYYGRTKLAGENAIRSSGVKFTIIRTNVLYGIEKYGRQDFVKWVVDSLKNKKTIRVVDDQINNPTFGDDLVIAINQVSDFSKYGIYNIGGKEFLSRYDFTLRIADFFNLDKRLIKKIITKELNQPAKRPLNSGLLNLKAEVELSYKPHSLEETFVAIQKEIDKVAH